MFEKRRETTDMTNYDIEGVAKKPLRIDVHTHILPRTWPDLKERYGYGGFIKLEHQCTAK